ncbi:MAG TPA: bifunctional nuclease family protein [Fimbriimonadaceae bacterium]|nr:bifunctional nuclease family protein [Fimbriimonadaceae bacterium]
MPEEFEGSDPEKFSLPPAFFPPELAGDVRMPTDLGELVEVSVEGVFAGETAGQKSQFVLLAEGGRKLPIMIGPFEAQAISFPIEGARPDRPMTHDLIKNLLDRLDADVDRVVIDDLWSTIYYAKIYVQRGDEEMEIDARPSDAIAIAVRYEVPIFVAEGLLESGSIE